MVVPVQDRFVTVNGLKLHYREWGEAGNPPLLLVHGLTRESHAFDRLAPALAGRFRCIAMDVRGRGDSDWGAPEDYSIAQYAADVRGLLAVLGLEQVHYIGVSMGGIISFELAAETPGLLLSLAVNDMGPQIAADSSQAVGDHVRRCGEGFDSLTELLDFETIRYPWYAQTPRPLLEESYQHLVRHQEDGRVTFHFDPNIVLGRTSTASGVGERYWEAWRKLTCPLLLVRGAESNILVPETVRRMQAAQPEMAFVEVPGVGHAPTLMEKPVLAAFDALYA